MHSYTEPDAELAAKFESLGATPQKQKFGPTGRFPDGKYTPNDQGEIAFGIAADVEAGKVLVDFGKPVHAFGMNRQQALDLAEALIAQANRIPAS